AERHDVSGTEPRLRVRQRHDWLAAQIEVKMALVPQMFDTPDGCRHVSTAGRNHQVLRPRANRRSAGWRAGKYLRRQKVYRRLTKPCRDMGVDRVLIDLARRADLHQPSGLDLADTGSHGHRFGLIVG